MSDNKIILDSIGIMNTAFSGMFSITALLPAAYALIVNTITKQFCGMPIVKIRRFKFIWFVLPLVYLCIVYISLLISYSSLLIFSFAFFIFMSYIAFYLYMLLLPLFKKDKFVDIAIRTLSKELSTCDDSKYLIYINETIKQFIEEKTIPYQTYCRIHEVFCEKIPQSIDFNISSQTIDFTRLLFLDNHSQAKYDSFFIKLDSLNMPLAHKYEYLSKMLSNSKYSSIEFHEGTTLFFSHSLKNYLYNNDLTIILNPAIKLSTAIISRGGFKFLLSDIYESEYIDAKYIQFLYNIIVRLKSVDYDLRSELLSQRDKIFIDELYEIIDDKKNDFEETLKYCKNLKTIDLIIKMSKKRN